MFFQYSLYDVVAGLLRRCATPHGFNYGSTSRCSDHGFTHTCCRSSTDIAIDEKPCADNGTIAHATSDFVGHTRSGASTSHSSAGIQGQHSDGVVIFDVDASFIFRFNKPLFIVFLHRWYGHFECCFGKTVLKRPFLCTLTNKHYVGCFFHDRSSHINRVNDIFQKGYRTTSTVVVHYTGIQSDMTVAVGPTA